MQKGLDAVSESEWDGLANRWIGAKFDRKNEEKTVQLTEQEQAFIRIHPVIQLGTSTDFAPYAILDKDGKLTGLAREQDNDIPIISLTANVMKEDIIKTKKLNDEQFKRTTHTIRGICANLLAQSKRQSQDMSVRT